MQIQVYFYNYQNQIKTSFLVSVKEAHNKSYLLKNSNYTRKIFNNKPNTSSRMFRSGFGLESQVFGSY